MIAVKNPLIRDILEQLTAYTLTDPFQWLRNTGLRFSIRQLDLMQDLPVIYQWVNQEYALPFWGMNGSYAMLFETYQSIRLTSFSESLTGWLGHQIICQIDIYDPAYDSIHSCYEHALGDLGFHLLMAPGQRPVQNSTAKIVWFFLQLVFQSRLVDRIIGEPDARNDKAQQMLRQLHFEFYETLALPHKEASFYTLTRERYISQTLFARL
ncbi:MAG: N-acetyltransferase [Hymenobacter sp.]|nr:MAG: N-acetyltransferase [Hymenobacter sp.]